MPRPKKRSLWRRLPNKRTSGTPFAGWTCFSPKASGKRRRFNRGVQGGQPLIGETTCKLRRQTTKGSCCFLISWLIWGNTHPLMFNVPQCNVNSGINVCGPVAKLLCWKKGARLHHFHGPGTQTKRDVGADSTELSGCMSH